MENWAFFALILPIICGFVSGACSFLLLNWGLMRVYLGIEYRLTDLEGKVIRETKIRASEMSRSGKNADRDLIEKIAEQNQKPEMTVEGWRQSKFLK